MHEYAVFFIQIDPYGIIRLTAGGQINWFQVKCRMRWEGHSHSAKMLLLGTYHKTSVKSILYFIFTSASVLSQPNFDIP